MIQRQIANCFSSCEAITTLSRLQQLRTFSQAIPLAAISHLTDLNWIQADQEAIAAAEVRHQQRRGRQMTS